MTSGRIIRNSTPRIIDLNNVQFPYSINIGRAKKFVKAEPSNPRYATPSNLLFCERNLSKKHGVLTITKNEDAESEGFSIQYRDTSSQHGSVLNTKVVQQETDYAIKSGDRIGFVTSKKYPESAGILDCKVSIIVSLSSGLLEVVKYTGTCDESAQWNLVSNGYLDRKELEESKEQEEGELTSGSIHSETFEDEEAAAEDGAVCSQFYPEDDRHSGYSDIEDSFAVFSSDSEEECESQEEEPVDSTDAKDIEVAKKTETIATLMENTTAETTISSESISETKSFTEDTSIEPHNLNDELESSSSVCGYTYELGKVELSSNKRKWFICDDDDDIELQQFPVDAKKPKLDVTEPVSKPDNTKSLSSAMKHGFIGAFLGSVGTFAGLAYIGAKENAAGSI
ncbi:hypothetical protein WICPIJ_001145 [Wickerhamomyces pijperi]|uniref:FHA domain-containing protein n=1 Tax=Wickerhamomyces pijperi TaxID=599730 RepID=A0A9P8QE82_WICPI|nr:hypothetical protein WICPIJ_001145 [Wickerhamomyces pijperi]